MDVSAALVAYPQPAELVQPSQDPLHHPAVNPQPAAVFRAPPSQGGRNAARPQFLALLSRVISPVGVQPLWPATGPAPSPPHRRHGVHPNSISSRGSNSVTSWRLAPVRIADNGVPLASVIR